MNVEARQVAVALTEMSPPALSRNIETIPTGHSASADDKHILRHSAARTARGERLVLRRGSQENRISRADLTEHDGKRN